METKLLSSSSQCPSVHQVLVSRFASADSTWCIPVWPSGLHTKCTVPWSTWFPHCSWGTGNLGTGCAKCAQPACSGSQPETPGLVQRGWQRAAWAQGPGAIQDREHKVSLGIPGSSWWQYLWHSGMVGLHWKEPADSFFLLCYLEVFISKTWLAPHICLVVELNGDENAQEWEKTAFVDRAGSTCSHQDFPQQHRFFPLFTPTSLCQYQICSLRKELLGFAWKTHGTA